MIWRRKRPDEPFEMPESVPRPLERHTFSLIGILPEQVLELKRMFDTAGRQTLSQALREEAGHPWASKAFEELWQEDPARARQRGLFDLIWHRRAMEYDPIVNAPDFAGFDILLDAASQISPELAELLAFVNGNDPLCPRRTEGPEWWEAWHQATTARPGGWLEHEEVRLVSEEWRSLATPEVEEVCLAAMRVPFTHSGCWTLMSDLGGFWAQCASERRAVVVEVDL